MKSLNITTKFLVSLFLSFSIFFTYDVFFVARFINNKFLDRFVVVVSIKDDADVEVLTKEIKLLTKKLKFQEISYIDKQQVFNFVQSETELGEVLNVLKTNPFFNVIRIRFNNFHQEEILKILNMLKTNSWVKDVNYDKNLLSYLTQLSTILNIYKIILICVVVYVIVLGILNFLQIRKLTLTLGVIFTLLYILMIFFNNKILCLMTKSKYVLNAITLLFYLAAYFVSVTNLFSTERGEEINA